MSRSLWSRLRTVAEICSNGGVVVVGCVVANLVVIICTDCTSHTHSRSPLAKIMSSENLNNNEYYYFLIINIISCHRTVNILRLDLISSQIYTHIHFILLFKLQKSIISWYLDIITKEYLLLLKNLQLFQSSFFAMNHIIYLLCT